MDVVRWTIIVIVMSSVHYILTEQDCGFSPVDVVFVLDSSGSVNRTNFEKELRFVSKFANEFDIGPKNVQIGVVTFSSTIRNKINLDQFSNKSDLVAAIQKIDYQPGTTHTGDALLFAMNRSFSSAHGDRPGVKNVMIVLTDGISNKPLHTMNAAKMVHDAGIETIAIGVGNMVSLDELRYIASDNQHVFQVSNFGALQTLQKELKNTTCEAITTSTMTSMMPTPPPLVSVECTDNFGKCSSYGIKVCTEYREWAILHCAKFCMFCHGQSSTKNATFRLHPVSTFETPPPPCVDRLDDCDQYGIRACLLYRAWAGKNCARTCGVCGVPTAKTGTILPSTSIRRSTIPTITEIRTTTSMFSPKTTNYSFHGECKDKILTCANYGPAMCYQFQRWALVQCPKFCVFCTPATTHPTAYLFTHSTTDSTTQSTASRPRTKAVIKTPTSDPPCKNAVDNCASLGPMVCFQKREWAERNCRVFCMFCSVPLSAAPSFEPPASSIPPPTPARPPTTKTTTLGAPWSPTFSYSTAWTLIPLSNHMKQRTSTPETNPLPTVIIVG